MTRQRYTASEYMLVAGVFVLICAPYPGFLGDGILRVIDLLSISTFLLFVVLSLSVGVTQLPKQRFVYSMLYILIGWQVVVILLSNTSASLFRDLLDIYKQIFWFISFLFGYMSSRYIREAAITRSIEIVFLVSSIVAVLQLLLGPSMAYYLFSVRGILEIESHYTIRVVGTLGNPNYFALFNIGMLYWSLSNSMTKKKFRFKVYSVLAIAMVVLAQSRTNIVAVAVLSVAFSWLVYRAKWATARHKSFFVRIVLLGAVAASLVVWWMIEFGVFRYIYTGFLTVYETGLASQSSFGRRLDMWSYFLNLIVERPIVGYGPSKGTLDYTVADNNYIFIAFKYGVVGLILTIVLWLYMVVKIWRRIRFDSSSSNFLALFLLLGVLFTSFFAETIDAMRIGPFVFLLCGLVLGREFVGRRRRDDEGEALVVAANNERGVVA